MRAPAGSQVEHTMGGADARPAAMGALCALAASQRGRLRAGRSLRGCPTMAGTTILLLLLLPAVAFAAAEEGAHGGGMTGWKWANFALLAGGLGYLIAKKAPAFFQGRTAEIRKGIDEAAKQKADAEARAAEITRKLENIGAEIEALRAGARKEMEAEDRRLREETAEQLVKIQSQAEREIASAVKGARMELKAYAAELALELAEKQIRARMTAEAERGLVAGFVRDLERQRLN